MKRQLFNVSWDAAERYIHTHGNCNQELLRSGPLATVRLKHFEIRVDEAAIRFSSIFGQMKGNL